MTPCEKFLTLLENDILRLHDAARDFGSYRILNCCAEC